jgi:GNAT superfamily N-acetyltransferase
MKSYQAGVWLVWYKGSSRIGISYHIVQAASNNRPWIGTILINPAYRSNGLGKEIISFITNGLYQKGHKVVDAAVPIHQNKWIEFLSSCQFEQYKIEEEKNQAYLLFVKPIEE